MISSSLFAIFLYSLASLADLAFGYGIVREAHRSQILSSSSPTITCRREILTYLVGSTSAILYGYASSAMAFENKISTKYDDRPKRRGPMPKDLGVATRITMENKEYLGLKVCGPAPNCFSSTIPAEEDPDHSIPSWTWPQDLGDDDKDRAFAQLYEILKYYPPGQNGVDGGGFEVQKYDPENGYIYVIFEALKNGYYDDVEFAWIAPKDGGTNREIQVRSSSRVGYLDYGVNAKRLNYIAQKLREKGWIAVGVDLSTHQGYALENQI